MCVYIYIYFEQITCLAMIDSIGPFSQKKMDPQILISEGWEGWDPRIAVSHAPCPQRGRLATD